MNIIIKTANHDLSVDTRALVEGKFRALDKFAAGGTLACEIEEPIAVERAGAKYGAEGNLTVNGRLFRAAATSTTLEGAIDQVRDDLVREVQRAEGKKKGLLKRGGAALKRMLRMG
jgi:ribosome-associated translation inhibitor RaiA